MKNAFIRRAGPQDLPYLYEICLKTGDEGKDATALFYDPYLIGQYFAAPYLFYPAGICFVVENGSRPQGYLVAAPDSVLFSQWMEESWLPPLRERYPKPFRPEITRSPKEKWILESVHKPHFPGPVSRQGLVKDYPAELHIDLLPCIQGKGWGRALMERLDEELARLGVKGVRLGVGIENQGAIAFYRKTGFSVLLEEKWGYIMGKTK